jgi:hypothetical protein
VAVSLDGATVQASVLGFCEGRLRYAVDGVVRSAIAVFADAQVHLALDGNTFVFTEVSAFPMPMHSRTPARHVLRWQAR